MTSAQLTGTYRTFFEWHMNKLIAELRRLYFFHDQQWHSQQADETGIPALLNLIDTNGMVRTVVMGFDRATDWAQVATLFQNTQEDLELPAPAISVSGKAGYQLWFSLAEPVPAAQAHSFLNGLRLKYLPDTPLRHLKYYPSVDESTSTGQSLLKLTPALHKTTGKWSAFIDPSMGSMFIDEPGLGMAPNMDRQADMLAGLQSIKAADFQRVLNYLQTPVETPLQAGGQGEGNQPPCLDERGALDTRGARTNPNIGNNFRPESNFRDPKSFLLAVMNDSSATVGQRIKAAKALLPYFEKSL